MVVSQEKTKIFKSNLISCYTKDLYIVMIQFKFCVWITKLLKCITNMGRGFIAVVTISLEMAALISKMYEQTFLIPLTMPNLHVLI